MIHHVTRATRHLIFWSLIVLGMGSIAIRLAFVAVEYYKIELAQKISEMSGLNIQIGSLKGGTRGFDPEIILREISFHSPDKTGKTAVKLQEVRVGLDIWRLLQSRDFLSSTWIALIGTKITIVRDKTGKISIKGLGAGDEDIPAWMLHFKQYEILDSEVTWRDWQASPLAFQQVDSLLRTDIDRQSYEFHLLAKLPPPYGGTVRLSAELHGDIFQGQAPAGRLYLQARQMAIPESLFAAKFDGLVLEAQPADFSFWLNWQDQQLQSMAGQWQGRQLRVANAGQQRMIKKLSTLFSWQTTDQGWRLDMADLNMECTDKQWPSARFSLAHVKQRIGLRASVLDLGIISFLLPLLPRDLKTEYAMTNWHLSGRLQDFELFAEAEQKIYALSGQFSALSIEHNQKLPSFSGVTGSIHGDSNKGTVWLDSAEGWLKFPGLFRNHLDFKQFQGGLNWSQSQTQWRIDSEAMYLKTEALEADSQFGISLPKENESIEVDMSLAFHSFQRVKNISRYLPTGIMQPELVKWLDEAKISADLIQGKMRLKGALEQFPFKHGEGKFEVLADIGDGVLQYSPFWLPLKQVKGQLHFLGNSLHIDIDNAYSHNIHSHHAEVSLPDLEDGETVLVKAELFGKVEHFLRFLQLTPLHGTVDNIVDALTVNGKAKVAFNLSVPLVEDKNFHVAGHFQLQQAKMQVKALSLPIEKINGIVNFTENGLFSNQLTGRLAGQALKADISSDPQQVTIASLGGMKTDVLYRLFPKLKNKLAKGRFNYQVKVVLPHRQSLQPEVNVYTDLKGVAIDLPVPLGKTLQQKRPLSVRVRLKPDQEKNLYLDYDDILKAAITLMGENSRMQSAHIRLGKGKANLLKGSGVWVEIRLAQLNMDDWWPLLAGDMGNKKTASSMRMIDAQIGQLSWQNNQLGPIKLQIKPGKRFWRVDLNSQLAEGELLLASQPKIEKNTLNLDRLDLDKLLALKSAKGPSKKIDLATLPLFDIYAEKLIFNSIDQGMLIVETERRQNTFHFRKISLVNETSSLEMSGDWFKTSIGYRTVMKGQLNSQDFTSFLDRLGFANDLRETSAKLKFNLAWAGTPYQLSPKVLDGRIDVELTGGRIASIEPGFGRLLGLIAIRQWVKRFSLDFSDIYKKGLAYNSIKGHFDITDGIARTHDLLIDAIAARIKVAGLVNLENKTLDAHVWVVPKSSAAVPIAGTIIGGIASAITRVFDEDYKEGYFFGSEYKISGSWSDANVTPLNGNNGIIRKFWQGMTVSPNASK